MRLRHPNSLCLALLTVCGSLTGTCRTEAAESTPGTGWIDLSSADRPLALWRDDRQGWTAAGGAGLDPANDHRLAVTPGSGVIVSDGDGADLLTVDNYRDVEFRCEFMIPKGSNSGVKLNALYEIQIRDMNGQEASNGDSCGGIYPRAELEPRYRLLDAGVPPQVNAARPAGQWQSLELYFYSPRFDAAGNKLANARFERVVLNGKVIHQREELDHPTGHAWNTKPEIPEGPVMLQGDHGPVAFRKVRIRRLPALDGQ
ncbi:MAG: DUF1080 domain-containing protein [Planctomycetota bacterium]|nr:MAG: DUF1080 domain-containing protein [Planctomycetota bacterium]